ncbi:hypothetical protein EB008_05495 [bacterium]|nr:hypothetical protein [bacterium]
MSNVVREINFYLNSRERDPPSTLQRPATVSNWSLDVPITLRNPANYFQICVRGFYSDPGLVISFVNSPTGINSIGGNWIRAHRNGHDAVYYLPTGNYTPQSLCDWANAAILAALGAGPSGGGLDNNTRFLQLDPVTGKCVMSEGNIDPTAVQVDFSVTMWRALGFGASIYGITESSPVVGDTSFGSTSYNVTVNSTFVSDFPVIAQPDRTLFVLYNGGVVDSYSTSTGEYRDFPGPIPSGNEQGSWPFGRSGGFKERRVIAAISLLSGNAANARIDYSASSFSYSTISTPFINNISLELATENWQVVPLVNTDYTIVLGLQECTPIAQTQPGIPQPIVVPKKGDEKDKTKDDHDNEEYIRQLAQQIKKRRLERAADRVDEQQSLPE